MNGPRLQQVHGIRAAFIHLEHDLARQSGRAQHRSRAARGYKLEPQRHKLARHRDGFRLVVIVHADEHGAFLRQRRARADLRLGKRFAEIGAYPHHFARGSHLRPQCGVHARKFIERKYRRFDEMLRHRQHAGLAHIWHGARRARVHLQHVHLALLNGILHVHQPDNVQRLRQAHGVVFDGVQLRPRYRLRRQHAGAIARMYAGLFDVLHDAGDQHLFSI